MKHKKYHDIKSFETKFIDGFSVGDYISIQEKIDGANASFQFDKESNSISSFSRRKILDEKDTLRGFRDWADNLNKSIFKKYLDYRFFGEWLIKHTLNYPKDKYYNFYLFDIFNTKYHKYLIDKEVKDIANLCELKCVPCFYTGEFISWEHINEFIGKTQMGGDTGEGIVVKNMERINDPNQHLPYYVKLVTKDFKEKMFASNREPLSLEEIQEKERQEELVSSIVTLPRIRKMLHNFVDEGILEELWSAKDLGIISKHLGRRMYEDCIKEEPDICNAVGKQFGKICAKQSMAIAKELISKE